jgi:hypothetical protein
MKRADLDYNDIIVVTRGPNVGRTALFDDDGEDGLLCYVHFNYRDPDCLIEVSPRSVRLATPDEVEAWRKQQERIFAADAADTTVPH